ncbi:hypothetical protein FA15DRAFT_299827 [Coprinopsis marcescibilis]|uniref:Uncharacterized protein n=1 Tax=Coprinopsis marcescibilis TaxID=230819 RepID=A0A5C3L027_COPMA|nr:hypothetical protein FA15DRAFT_299827 [Coprinopsis marcescibilis]
MHHGIGDLMLSTSVADQDEEYFFHSVELLFSSFNQHVESTLPHSLPFASPPPPPPSPFSSASASSPYPYPFFAYPSQNQASPWRNPTKWREVVDPTLYQQHFLAPFLTTFERGFDLQMLGMWSAARSGTLDELSASVGEANWTLSALTGPAPTAYISVAHISCNVQLDFLDEVACGLMEEMCVGQYGRMVDYLWKGLFRLERLAGTRARASRSLEGVLGNLDLDSERLRWCAFFDRCALGRCEALNRIYAFVGRAVSDRDPHATSKRFSSPRDKFGAHVRRVARADVAGLVAVRQNSGPGVLGAGDLKIYLDVLLGVYRRFGPRLERMVELDVVFKPALDDAFGDVVNENEFLRTWSTTPSEILLKRLNGLLKQAPLAGLGAELDDLVRFFLFRSHTALVEIDDV